MLSFVFVFSITTLDIILSYMGWKPTFGDDILAGIIGFLPSVGSVALSMLIGTTQVWRTKILSGIIWLFCVTISLTGNFLNMTSRAFESLETENIAKTEVINLKDKNEAQINIFKDANKEQLDLYDQEIADLTVQFEQARESRDFQINDGVNRDGTMGPKARAFQASMDRISEEIEKKRTQKRELQTESAKALLEFQSQSLDKVSEANVELTETQNDMRGHMPVIRYFIPNTDMQRQVVLWGLGLFAAVISLAGPVVSYATAVHVNHKKSNNQKPPSAKKNKKKSKAVIDKQPEQTNINIVEVESDEELEEVVEENKMDEELPKSEEKQILTSPQLSPEEEFRRKRRIGYL